jgi:hypothetical protein
MSAKRRVITDESVLAEVGAMMEKDAAFMEQLRQNPQGTLVSLGIEVPVGVLLRLEPDSPTTAHLAVYVAETELTEEDLKQVAGGVTGPPSSFTRRVALTAPLKLVNINLAWDEIAYNVGL